MPRLGRQLAVCGADTQCDRQSGRRLAIGGSGAAVPSHQRRELLAQLRRGAGAAAPGARRTSAAAWWMARIFDANRPDEAYAIPGAARWSFSRGTLLGSLSPRARRARTATVIVVGRLGSLHLGRDDVFAAGWSAARRRIVSALARVSVSDSKVSQAACGVTIRRLSSQGVNQHRSGDPPRIGLNSLIH